MLGKQGGCHAWRTCSQPNAVRLDCHQHRTTQSATGTKVARWLAGLYDRDGYLRPLKPDLLGEAQVAAALMTFPTWLSVF